LGLFSNKPLLAAVVLTIGLQMTIMYIPVLQTLFQTTSLSVIDLTICFGLSTIVFWAIELEKWFTRLQQESLSGSKIHKESIIVINEIVSMEFTSLISISSNNSTQISNIKLSY
jgi:magnesium-transporting ATPase (P-type)